MHIKVKKILSSVFLFALFLSLFSCQTVEPIPTENEKKSTFIPDIHNKHKFATPEKIKKMAKKNKENKGYLIGPGDVLSLKVWHRPQFSNPNLIVGPDGIVTINRIGNINVNNLTREQASQQIHYKISKLYTNPEIILSIKAYRNNKAFILGRVQKPGVVNFPGEGTLLEAISLAGGLPVLSRRTYLTRCSIIRGKESIVWIDLQELLQNGNMALNVRIQNNDVIFIPDNVESLVYVMGEVKRPGVIILSPNLNFLDALMMTGGPSINANLNSVYILRFNGKDKEIKEIDLQAMLNKADFTKNFLLKDNDIIYVAEKGISKFRYVMEQFLPFIEALTLTTRNLEDFGVMQKLRQSLWGQQGFVPQ